MLFSSYQNATIKSTFKFKDMILIFNTNALQYDHRQVVFVFFMAKQRERELDSNEEEHDEQDAHDAHEEEHYGGEVLQDIQEKNKVSNHKDIKKARQIRRDSKFLVKQADALVASDTKPISQIQLEYLWACILCSVASVVFILYDLKKFTGLHLNKVLQRSDCPKDGILSACTIDGDKNSNYLSVK